MNYLNDDEATDVMRAMELLYYNAPSAYTVALERHLYELHKLRDEEIRNIVCDGLLGPLWPKRLTTHQSFTTFLQM